MYVCHVYAYNMTHENSHNKTKKRKMKLIFYLRYIPRIPSRYYN